MDKIGFLFSGQGAQTPGMMKKVYEESKAAREVFEIAGQALGRDIASLCFEGTQEELNLTHNTQPCMLAADLAAYMTAVDKGIEPTAVAGFSLGEYAALVASGVLAMEDAFRLIQIRADAMQEAVPVGKGAMAAIMKVGMEKVQALCDSVAGYVVPANINSPAQIVISGENDAVEQVLEIAKKEKIRAVRLAVSAPFHCKLMEPARRQLEDAFRDVVFKDARVPIYMNCDGRPYTEADDIREKVLLQTVSPVQWIATINNMAADGLTLFMELGVGSTLVSFVHKINSDLSAFTMEDEAAFNEIATGGYKA